MEPVMTAIGTMVLMKASEKAGEKLGERVFEQGSKLLSLLKSKLPSIANAIELSQQQPLDYGKAVLELEAVTNEDIKIAQAIEELDAEIKADSKLSQAVQAKVNELQYQPQIVQHFGEIKDSKGFVQGINYGGIHLT